MNTDNYAVMLLESEVLDLSLKKYASKIVTKISNLTEDNFLDTELLAYRLAVSVKSIVDLLRQKTNTRDLFVGFFAYNRVYFRFSK